MNTGQRTHAWILLGLSCPSGNCLYCLGSELWVGRWNNCDVIKQRVSCLQLQCGSDATVWSHKQWVHRKNSLPLSNAWTIHGRASSLRYVPGQLISILVPFLIKTHVSYTNSYAQYIWKCLKIHVSLVFFKNDLYLFVIYVCMQDDVSHSAEMALNSMCGRGSF